jgi:two-component system, NarL family, nitrate/nitrite response regulator NarL
LAPTVPIVVLSGSEASEHIKRALDNGAVGYIPKSSSSHEMLAALRIVMQGDVFIPPKLLSKLGTSTPSLQDFSENQSSQSPLTSRQLEVLELMVRGLPNKSIAKTLDVAEGTVKLHVAAILRALGARNRTQAVAEATRLGWVPTTNQNHYQ